ncbi:ABC transporter ATP-binding protein [Myxococcota bacterium]|nr:ABC transporter ATP-binding protein [Myxococcota bacterium]
MDALPVAFEEVGFAWPAAPAPLLRGFGLRCPAGTLTALVGPSGCGKSTLLRLAAGLLLPQEGRVAPGASARGGLAMVFQQPNLLAWRTVADNVGLPLELRGVPVAARRDAVAEALGRVELEDVAQALPAALSGGMRMRVALARAWVQAPRLLVMDEPFAALDALTRGRMYDRFQALWEQGRPTGLLVTHDVDEAVLLADRVVVLGGRPLGVVAEVAVDLPRPRSASLRHEPALGALVRQVEAHL